MSHLVHYHLCIDCREQHTVDRAVAIAAGNPDPYDPDVGVFDANTEDAYLHAEATGHRITFAPIAGPGPI